MTEQLFQMASRKKLRFPFNGSISTEDLWDLNTTQLNSIYQKLNTEHKKATEDSLLDKKTEKDKALEEQIEIVKFVFTTLKGEADARLLERERKEKKKKILEILESKQDESLKNKTPEELQKMLEDL
jgi:hypothetical protein